MVRNQVIAFALGVSLLVVGLPALAHHSISAEFDREKPIEFTGKVVQVDWLNPHIYTHVEVTEGPEAGKVFKVEGSPPNSLFRNGWRPDTLEPGQTVTVAGVRARNPESPNVGQATLTTEDGQTVFRGRNQ